MLVYQRVNQLNWPYRVLFIQEWAISVLKGGTVSCTVSYLSVCYKYKVQNQWKNMWRQQSPAIPKGCKRKTLKTHHFCWVVSFQLPNLLPIWHPQECEKTQRIMLLKQQTHTVFEGPPGFCVVSSFLAVVCVCVSVCVSVEISSKSHPQSRYPNLPPGFAIIITWEISNLKNWRNRDIHQGMIDVNFWKTNPM